MIFKVGDRVQTTDDALGSTHTEYHNVIGTIIDIRSSSTLPIMSRYDTEGL